MPLVPATLQTAIESVFSANTPNPTEEQQAQITAMAIGLTNAFDTYIRSGIVSGTCVNGAGAGTITGTIS
jgi:hypothetical protein